LLFNLLSLFCTKKISLIFFTVDKFYNQATFSKLATTNARMKQYMIYLEFTFPGL
jgi:CRISPR/Cas system-associated endonuclease Cas1